MTSKEETAMPPQQIMDRPGETISPPPAAATTLPEDIDVDSVYDFYKDNLFPAIKASLPLLFHRVSHDIRSFLAISSEKATHFLLPGWSSDGWQAPNFVQMMEQAASNSTVHDFMLRHFDTNHDGSISPSELLNMTEILSKASLTRKVPTTWLEWFSREWPLMDWKLGVFLWRSCSGLLILIALVSLLPGRLHGFLGRMLRWPVLGITYFMITVELCVYIVIRIFIRLIESTFMHSKHRRLRSQMRAAKSYEEWYDHAQQLDISQGRHEWRKVIHDETGYRYNWGFVRELIRDLRKSRQKRDSLMALAVLQQCTRKNVGGIMSEESFSFTNTGEPKMIVKEFVKEVAITLRWVTSQCRELSEVEIEEDDMAGLIFNERDYDSKLQKKVQQEKYKIWGSLVSWATLNFKDGEGSETVAPLSTEDGPRSRSSSWDSLPPPTPEVTTTGASPSVEGTLSVGSDEELPAFHKEKVVAFLKRARAAYGRTALCLSGGAMMGLYHFGHVKALLEQGLLPNIISGTSAGSVIAAMLCTRTDEELRVDLEPKVLAAKLKCFHLGWGERLKNLYNTGCMFEFDYWRKLIRWFTFGDLTFEEAFKKTGRVFCITLSATTKKAPPVLINHISAPNVVIGSAVIASAAVPGLIKPVRLEVKGPDGKISYQGDMDQTYWDGSIEQDIPTSGLAEMLNCQFFVAAQCNPHIVPFFYNCRGGVGRPSRWSSGTRENAWRGGFLLSALELYLKSDMRAKFQFLNDIEAAVGFTGTMMIQKFGGSTTIVPQVSLIDYTQLMSDPSLKDIQRYESVGSVAAYEHCAMIRLHYHIVDALDECLRRLAVSDEGARKVRQQGTSVQQLAHHAALNINSAPPMVKLPDAVASASTETSSSADEDDDETMNGFDQTEGYVSSTRKRKSFVRTRSC